MVLGGGGYTKANVARCWANETAALVKQPIPERLPNTQYDAYFADDFTLRLKDLGRRRIENYMARQHGLPEDLRIQDLASFDEDVL